MYGNLPGFSGATTYAKNKKDFLVFINKGELNQIYDWVLKHDNIETGGDLFGLWIDEHTAVVQLVLGPGENCRRYPTSFFQDVNYLKNAGSYLTKAHGLCNIGQWHSHHRIGLFEPSAGDDNTVWNNMPSLGLDRYIVCIANITDTVKVNCFLYQIKNGRELPVKLGEFHELDANSPFRRNENLFRHINIGAESFNQMPVFEKENPKIVNNDAKKSLNISVQNESRSGNYTGNGVQNTSVVSGGRQETVNSHNPNPLTDKAKEPEKHSITKQTKQLDNPQSIQSQETTIVKNNEKMTKNYQNTSGVSDGQQKAVNSYNEIALGDKTKKRDNNQNKLVTAKAYHVPAPPKLTVKRLEDDRSTSRTSKKTQSRHNIKPTTEAIQSGQGVKTTSPDDQIPMKAPITNNQDQQFTFHTTLPQAQKQQEHAKKTSTTTQRGSENYYTPPTSLTTQKGCQIDDEKYDSKTTYKNKNTCQDNLQKQNTTVSYIGSKGVVPVKQQEPDSTIIKPRITSDECDNVPVTFEEPQFKTYRSKTEVNEDLATVAERPSTPSGTFSAHGSHDEGKETEGNCDVEKRTKSWSDFICTWMCGRFKQLSISEPDSKQNKRGKKRDDNRKRSKTNSFV